MVTALAMSWQALMSLFVLSSKDGWVNIMYDGLDAVGIDQQVRAGGRQPWFSKPGVPKPQTMDQYMSVAC